MYGQIHCCVRSLILEKFGEEIWKKIVQESKIDEVNDFKTFHQYDDEPTMRLVAAVAKVAGLEIEVVLEVFGEYFLEYCMKHGYDKMLATLGGSFETFIQNLDSLHALLQLSYKNIQAPSFRCVSKGAGLIELHYYSYRSGLYPIVKGLVREVARRLFHVSVIVEVLEISSDIQKIIQGVAGHSFVEYVKFQVQIEKSVQEEGDNLENSAEENSLAIPKLGDRENSTLIFNNNNHGLIVSSLAQEVFCEIFPYHILFNKEMKVLQMGTRLRRMVTAAICFKKTDEIEMEDIFELIHPMMDICYNNIMHFMNAVFLLKLRSETSFQLTLKGQMVPEPQNDRLFFIGSPRIESLFDLQSNNIYLSDIPIYDVTRELVLLNQQRIAEIEVSKKLDETTAELKKMAIELEKEKSKTDRLLHEMLPPKVADQLIQGKTVEAEKFKDVTIFFSDIVTFTNIAAASTPMEIVGMLNRLYASFDKLTNKHGVYKVETIGDAYMVVCGVPEAMEDHALRVGDFAVDAIQAAKEVISPATGKPLQIRVGIHSGPVVAGVVGVRMPRYCLFGDTVNTASRMESHGLPECVHCSPTAHKNLESMERFKFVPRGETEIKGKGIMNTYFLVSNGDVTLSTPDLTQEHSAREEKKKSLAHGGPTKKEINKQEPTFNGVKDKKVSENSVDSIQQAKSNNKSLTCSVS